MCSVSRTYGTCEELGVEHVDSLIFPGILTVQVDSVQKVFNKCGQHHGQQDCVLKDKQKRGLWRFSHLN